MERKMQQIYSNAYISGGEKYFSIEIIREYISVCNSLNIIIIAMEFYLIKGNLVQPFEELQAFDASILFNETLGKVENSKRCNAFILDCYEKCKNKLQKCYFTSIEII